MKIAIDPMRTEHEWAAQALPWWVNKTLADEDARRFRAHLAGCEECRRDLAIEENLARRMATRRVVDYAPHASLAKLTRRLDRSPAAIVRGWWRRRGSAGEGPRAAFSFVIGAQAAALIVLTFALTWLAWQPQSGHERYTLAGGGAPSLPHLQVVFDEKTSATDVLAILSRVHGRILGGPSSAGVYLVAIDAPGENALDSAASTLQDQAGVRFVAVVRAPPQR